MASPIDLLNGNSTVDKVMHFITHNLSDFNIPIADILFLDTRENEKYKIFGFLSNL